MQRPTHTRAAESPLDDPDGPIVPLPGQELTPFDYPDGPHILPPSLANRDYGYGEQVWESERAPTLRRAREDNGVAPRADRTGFVWQLGVGYSSAFLFSGLHVPSLEVSGFVGASLRRRPSINGGRKSALGALAQVELPVLIHRYHFALTGVAGRHNTFYWRFNTGLSFLGRQAAYGIGGNVGVGIDLGRDRITALTLAIMTSIDLGAASAGSIGLGASILRF